MHLTECVDLFSESNQFDEEVRQCVYQWMFRTKTNFYGYGDIGLDHLFASLCFSYTLGGMTLYMAKPKWAYESIFPYDYFAFAMTFIQGPLSFAADYMNMTNDSMFHAIDRVMAVFNMVVRVCHIACLYWYSRPSIFYLNLVAVSFAAFSFMMSQDAQESHDAEGFYFWHNCWHLYPLICIPLELTDKFVLEEYEYAASPPKYEGAFAWICNIFRDLKFAFINEHPSEEAIEEKKTR